MTTIGDLIGLNEEELSLDFDLKEISEVLQTLQIETAVDLPQAENMQRMALRGADLLSDYLGKIVNKIGVHETKLTKLKAQALLDYDNNSKSKTSADMRKAASEADTNVVSISLLLSSLKAAKFTLDKKYDILIKSHHYYKDIAAGFKRTIGTDHGSQTSTKMSKSVDGWD